MVFEYLPESVGQHESVWLFEIPSLKQSQRFHIIGEVKEPNVFIDTGKVNFGPLLLMGKSKEQVRIKNLENVPVQFQFDRDSFKSENNVECLSLSPMSGTVRANSE